jgi:hypothetical protein
MPYHARHSLLCLALIFTRSADTPNPRQHRRQAAAPFREAARRATNADHSHFLGHANCALLAGRPISSRCGRHPRLPAGFNPSSRLWTSFVMFATLPPPPTPTPTPQPRPSASSPSSRSRRWSIAPSLLPDLQVSNSRQNLQHVNRFKVFTPKFKFPRGFGVRRAANLHRHRHGRV